jgi:prepilin-type N-terminal cleavage/methylation domain-containing protein
MIRNQRGFALLEVLVAIVLFSVAILLFSSVFVSSFHQSKTEDTRLVAINLARQVASEWGSKSYDELSNDIGKSTSDMQGKINVNDRDYYWKVSVTPSPNASPPPQIDETIPMVIIKVEINDQNSMQPLAVVHSSVGQ